MKILIIGKGQFGQMYYNHLSAKGHEVLLERPNITSKKEVDACIATHKPDALINTAAKTSLEWCEQHKLETFDVNVLGSQNLAESCDKHGVYFIHISSGCIFESRDENDVKIESSIPNPSAYYAFTKAWSEQMVPYRRSGDFKYLILRPRQPVSAQVHHKNMLMKMLTFTKWIDTPNGGTVLEDLMTWTDVFLQKQPTGVVHVANKGFTTPYKIGQLLKKYVLPDLPVEKITKEELDRIMPNRRVDTVLGIERLESIVGEVSSYEVRLEEIIQELATNIKNADKEVLLEQFELTAAQAKQRTVVSDAYQKLLKA